MPTLAGAQLAPASPCGRPRRWTWRPAAGPGPRVGQHGVHGLAAEPGLPVRAVRMVPEGADQLEAAASVVGAEQRRRFGAGPDHVRLVRAGRHQLPDPPEAGAGVGRERDRRVVGLVPGDAEVVACRDAGTEV